MHCARFVVMLALGASAAARAEIVDIRWSADGRFEHQGLIKAGKFVELCGRLPAGLTLRWDFDASTPVDFNVHYHLGKEVVFPTRLSGVASARDTLTTTTPQDYCWMWSNKTAVPVTLSVGLQR